MQFQGSLRDMLESELTKEDIELPIPNQVAATLNSLLSDERVSVGHLAEIIEKDPGLTAKILNLSNSPLYAGLAKIKAVEQAIARLGMKTVQNFVMSILVKDMVITASPHLKELLQVIWRHSLGCAICSRRIALQVNLPQVSDDAYLLGLLHDIGTISIVNTISRIVQSRARAIELHEDLSLEVIKTFHAPLGEKILRKLNFEEAVCAIVGAHHEPECSAGLDENLFNILQVADNVMTKVGISLWPDPDILVTGLHGAVQLGLDPLFVSVTEVDIEETMANIDSLL